MVWSPKLNEEDCHDPWHTSLDMTMAVASLSGTYVPRRFPKFVISILEFMNFTSRQREVNRPSSSFYSFPLSCVVRRSSYHTLGQAPIWPPELCYAPHDARAELEHSLRDNKYRCIL